MVICLKYCPVPARTGWIFAATRKGKAGVAVGGIVLHGKHFSMWSPLSFASFLIFNMVAITVPFLVSLLFLVNRSYNILCFQFSPSWCRKEGERKREQVIAAWSGVSVGTLNWEIPFLNQDSLNSASVWGTKGWDNNSSARSRLETGLIQAFSVFGHNVAWSVHVGVVPNCTYWHWCSSGEFFQSRESN